jgi:hypothetical protein
MLRVEEILRIKRECGFNVVGNGAEAYGLGGYAAVFEKAIEPYLFDLGTTSATQVSAAGGPTVTSLLLASNPPIMGLTNQTQAFVQGSLIVVDVGPCQEQYVTILALNGLMATVLLSQAHGQYGSYPVLVQGAEFAIRDILTRIDTINAQLSGVAPMTAGVEKASEVTLSAAEKGRRGKRNKFDDLNAQRDLARKDLAAALGVPNLWETRGKYGGSGGGGGSLTYEPY